MAQYDIPIFNGKTIKGRCAAPKSDLLDQAQVDALLVGDSNDDAAIIYRLIVGYLLSGGDIPAEYITELRVMLDKLETGKLSMKETLFLDNCRTKYLNGDKWMMKVDEKIGGLKRKAKRDQAGRR